MRGVYVDCKRNEAVWGDVNSSRESPNVDCFVNSFETPVQHIHPALVRRTFQFTRRDDAMYIVRNVRAVNGRAKRETSVITMINNFKWEFYI